MSTEDTVKVWDPLVRVLHWTLVAAFTVAFVTGEEVESVHEWAGYVVLAVVGVRLLWGVIGTRHARFGDFVFRPSVVLGYARDVLKGGAKRYLGHNPLGGAMIVALLVSLFATGATGLALESDEPTSVAAVTQPAQLSATSAIDEIRGGAEPGERSLYRGDSDKDKDHDEREGEGLWEEAHEFFANFTLLLVFLHIGGVMLSSFMHSENLVRAMFTGRKPLKSD
jgi:cytochrome b